MRRKKLLFVGQQALGWKTHAAQFSRVVASRTDVDSNVILFQNPKPRIFFSRRNNLNLVDRFIRRLDPINEMRGGLGKSLRNEVSSIRPDFIHCAAHWPAASIAWEKDAPPFSVALDHTRSAMERDLPRGAWTEKAMFLESSLLERAAHVFAFSTWAANSVIADCGIPPQKVALSLPSYDLSRFRPKVHRSSGLPRIIFIGGDFQRKGGDRLVSWVNGPLLGKCELHIVSKNSSASGRYIHNHGTVPNERVITELFPHMDLLCIPTRSDMSSFVVAEAAAAGIPSVASRITGITDLIVEGKTGVTIPPDDSEAFISTLDSLIADPDRRHEMGQMALAYSKENFDATKNFNSWIDSMLNYVR